VKGEEKMGREKGIERILERMVMMKVNYMHVGKCHDEMFLLPYTI
jgi:hypothetical protein